MKMPTKLGTVTAVGSISINASLYGEIALYIKTSTGGFLPPVIINTKLLSSSPLTIFPSMFFGETNYLGVMLNISLTEINYIGCQYSGTNLASIDAWGIK